MDQMPLLLRAARGEAAGAECPVPLLALKVLPASAQRVGAGAHQRVEAGGGGGASSIGNPPAHIVASFAFCILHGVHEGMSGTISHTTTT